MRLVASAQHQELDLGMYLKSVITHLVRGTARMDELLPDRWKVAHPEAMKTYREQERREKAHTAKVRSAKRRMKSQLLRS
ncbi:hypothetical protein SH501x_000874 [Pirellulaceae bacterium SH501]